MKISIRYLFVIILFSGIFYLSLRPVIDPDFWWHLRTGQLIEQTNEIPRVDPYSFTMQGRPWITHEWLSEILISELYKIGGFALLTITFSLIITGAYILAYVRSPFGSRPYVAGFTVLLAAIASGPLWGVRPQMFTLIFCSLFLFLLDRYRENGDYKIVIPIPLIMLLWVNLHAGYFLGLAILMTYLVGWAIESGYSRILKSEVIGVHSKNPFKILFFVFIATVLVLPLNPVGFKIFIYPFQTLFDPAMQAYIQEWLSPNFHDLMWIPLAVLILSLIGAGMIGRKRLSVTQILTTLGFGFAALQSARHVPLFAVAVAPILAEEICDFIKIIPTTRPANHLLRRVYPIFIGVIVLIQVFALFQLPQQQQKAEEANYPMAAVDWIIRNKPDGNMFNSYSWGGYLIWRLYPAYPVYIDGRADLYGSKFFSNYIYIYSAKLGWKEELVQQNIKWVFIEPDSNLANSLRDSSDWEVSYEDLQSVVFCRK